MSNQLYDLSIVRKKLVIKQLREITEHDLVPVRETLNSIDFIMGDDDYWEYADLPKGSKATTKVRLYYSEEIIQFLKDNNDSTKLVMDSIDHTFITELTQVYKIELEGKSEGELRSRDKDTYAKDYKESVMTKIKEATDNINMLAETMGEIL